MVYEQAEGLEVVKFDGVNATIVYIGGLSELVKAELVWRKENTDMLGDVEVLTLGEIAEQVGGHNLITVIVETPMHGDIYQYGNYGNYWCKIGETCGYA